MFQLMKRKNTKGFTLIELMIVVAIIGILAAIAIPNFLKFQAKSKQSEAKTNLKGIYTAETGYFGENNRYDNFGAVNWEPVGTSRYQFVLANSLASAVDNTHRGSMSVSGGTLTWTGSANPTFDNNSFTAGAAGNIDNDTGYDCWTITDLNVLTNTLNDV
jgi:type IV pilus assembly protein PilA